MTARQLSFMPVTADEDGDQLDLLEYVATVPADRPRHDDLTAVYAADLRPGMIVTDDHGVRRFAAFDVDAHPDIDSMMRVWTAISDQDAGQPPLLLIHADDLLWTARRP